MLDRRRAIHLLGFAAPSLILAGQALGLSGLKVFGQDGNSVCLPETGSPEDNTPVPTSNPSGLGKAELSYGDGYGGDLLTFEINVMKIDRADKVGTEEWNQEFARGVFVKVELVVENIGTKPGHLPYDLELVNSAGEEFFAIRLVDNRDRVYSFAQDAFSVLRYNEDTESLIDDLQPGIKYNYGLPFDVPVDAKGLVLMIDDESIEVPS